MIRTGLAIAIATVTVLTSTARADQCAWVAPEVAERAVAELVRGRRVVHYCELCKPARRSPPVAIRKSAVAVAVRARRAYPTYREVILDGRAVDLAYLFVERTRGVFDNVAALAGCEAHGVSRSLR
jgi:hypothetical protein